MLRRRSRLQTAPAERVPAPAPAEPASWEQVVDSLVDDGYESLDCPALCRRKGAHEHMRHEAASADLIVSPAAVERSGA